MKKIDDKRVIESSGNIFADIGVKDPEEMLVKAKLVLRIAQEIKERGLTQADAAELIGVPQPRISQIFNGKFRDISETKLLNCLNKLGYNVKIQVEQKKQKALGHTTLAFVA